MDATSPTINRILYAFCGLAFAVPCIVFAQFAVRLIYRNLITEHAESRSFWMLVWAIAFPAAAIFFGLISWFFIEKARRGIDEK